jgi:hypothetical protein
MEKTVPWGLRLPAKLLHSLREAAKFKRMTTSMFAREALKEKIEKTRGEFRESQNA